MKKLWKIIGGIAIVAGVVAIIAKIVGKYRECDCFQEDGCNCGCDGNEFYFEEGDETYDSSQDSHEQEEDEEQSFDEEEQPQ